MTEKNKFSADYKKEIVKLITDLGKKPVKVAEDIGVSATTIRRWVQQYNTHGDQAFPGKGNLKSDDAERKALERKIKDLEEENAILKKAMAIFSRGAK